jgi:pyruvate dehydrogenase E1 component
LRDFFEVDARHITFATLSALVREYGLPHEMVRQAMRNLEIRPDKANPMRV